MHDPSETGTFLKKGHRFKDYMFYPRFLLDMELSESAKLIYILLLDRGRLSSTHPEWADERGNVFVIFDIADLSACSRKSKRTVTAALQELETADLIHREKQIIGQRRRIYIKLKPDTLPPSHRKNRPHTLAENRPHTLAENCAHTLAENCSQSLAENCSRTLAENRTYRRQKSSSPVGRNLPPYISNNNINNNYINNNFRNKYDPYYFEEGESL